jgi:hypothetical protein
LRHDPLLYSLVNRVRQALGKYTSWLVATAGGYCWEKLVKVVTIEHRETTTIKSNSSVNAPMPSSAENTGPVPSSIASQGLNHRQLVILSELEKCAFSLRNSRMITAEVSHASCRSGESCCVARVRVAFRFGS